MTGIFNNRLPQPRYTFTWDVGTVINFLDTLDSNTIELKLLTYKFASLKDSLEESSGDVRTSAIINLSVIQILPKYFSNTKQIKNNFLKSRKISTKKEVLISLKLLNLLSSNFQFSFLVSKQTHL